MGGQVRRLLERGADAVPVPLDQLDGPGGGRLGALEAGRREFHIRLGQRRREHDGLGPLDLAGQRHDQGQGLLEQRNGRGRLARDDQHPGLGVERLRDGQRPPQLPGPLHAGRRLGPQPGQGRRVIRLRAGRVEQRTDLPHDLQELRHARSGGGVVAGRPAGRWRVAEPVSQPAGDGRLMARHLQHNVGDLRDLFPRHLPGPRPGVAVAQRQSHPQRRELPLQRQHPADGPVEVAGILRRARRDGVDPAGDRRADPAGARRRVPERGQLGVRGLGPLPGLEPVAVPARQLGQAEQRTGVRQRGGRRRVQRREQPPQPVVRIRETALRRGGGPVGRRRGLPVVTRGRILAAGRREVPLGRLVVAQCRRGPAQAVQQPRRVARQQPAAARRQPRAAQHGLVLLPGRGHRGEVRGHRLVRVDAAQRVGDTGVDLLAFGDRPEVGRSQPGRSRRALADQLMRRPEQAGHPLAGR